ncbi:hypothetical protein BV25DRAFT_1920519 [Artomyces pyxidatus]|uniref:Uncharacterized protein n=1 Tax=Artomyces pyxidatus TaxID=48021 RepID=A0ACB8SMN6_9AGAM|nr:hypothetical protein BV25DRAFT_1920519 [Artomyces pyxidatus]
MKERYSPVPLLKEMVVDQEAEPSAPITHPPVKICRPGHNDTTDSRTGLNATPLGTEPSLTLPEAPASGTRSPIKIRRHGRGDASDSRTLLTVDNSGTRSPVETRRIGGGESTDLQSAVKTEAGEAPFDRKVRLTSTVDPELYAQSPTRSMEASPSVLLSLKINLRRTLAAADADAEMTLSDEEFNAMELQYPVTDPGEVKEELANTETTLDTQPTQPGNSVRCISVLRDLQTKIVVYHHQNAHMWRQDMLHRLSVMEEGLSEISGICQQMMKMYGVED